MTFENLKSYVTDKLEMAEKATEYSAVKYQFDKARGAVEMCTAYTDFDLFDWWTEEIIPKFLKLQNKVMGR